MHFELYYKYTHQLSDNSLSFIISFPPFVLKLKITACHVNEKLQSPPIKSFFFF